jgi:membrane-associated phospholipid phosphatase
MQRTHNSGGGRETTGVALGQRRLARFGLPMVLVLAGLAALSIDLPVARWFIDGRCPGALVKLCSLAEVFGHGLGVAMIIASVYVLDPAGRRFVPRIVAAVVASGATADLLKLLVARDRPRHFSFQGGTTATFGQWLPMLRGGSDIQSFPSSHVAVAAGLAIALAWLYPRGRWLFAALACLAAGQRLTTGAHFVSDVLWGAAVGCLIAPSCLPAAMLDRLLARSCGRMPGALAAPSESADSKAA